MCDFLSFFASVEQNKLVCGNPTSHFNAPVHSGQGDWRECEWVDNKLTIRVTNGDDESAYRATILSKAKNLSELVKYFSGKGADIKGNTFYFNEKGFHRIDGPARVWTSGAVEYWLDNKLHRTDGPAIIRADGYVAYWVNGEKVDPF